MNGKKARSAAAFLTGLILCVPAFAQGPDAAWRTISTPHFRIHFPAEDEAWAGRVAGDIESVRADVVLEGYATVVEGRITGSGRPAGSLRAAILRKWAVSGRLPSYAQLNADRRFLGMSMAYLVGSAYLEWLEQRGGPESLRHLWARMT